MRGISLTRVMQSGIKSLMLHKMRTLLTMLGIIFGVCSVISMLAIGEGASYKIQEEIKSQGTRNIIIENQTPPADSSAGGSVRSRIAAYGLTYRDYQQIKDTVPGVARVLPQRAVRKMARFGTYQVECDVIGTLPFYMEITNSKIVQGRFISRMDDKLRENYCVLTQSLARKMFPYQKPTDHALKIGSTVFKVVGIIGDTGQDAAMAVAQPLDAKIYIPLQTCRERFGEQIVKRGAGTFQAERVELTKLIIEFETEDQVVGAVPLIQSILQSFHQKRGKPINDYAIDVPIEKLNQAQRANFIFKVLLGLVAFIALLVGGIGIMNIMLATVTERTREIGIRRALGAKKKHIVIQFLIESGVLSITGGLIGVLLGIFFPSLLVQGINLVFEAEYKSIVTVWSVGVAFIVSVVTGVVFGLYPARRAADLDPIEALRHT